MGVEKKTAQLVKLLLLGKIEAITDFYRSQSLPKTYMKDNTCKLKEK